MIRKYHSIAIMALYKLFANHVTLHLNVFGFHHVYFIRHEAVRIQFNKYD